jgi:colanic acid/amylovoran biosynthesis protein
MARRMAPKANVSQSIDVAFALPYDRRQRSDSGAVEVGVNVSGLLFGGGHTGLNEFGMQISYADYTRRLIKALSARAGVSVKLLAHVNSVLMPHEDDRRIIDQLAAEFDGIERVGDFASPSEAKSYISGLDFLIGGRMHACIAAISSGVPVVPVAYSRKFTGLFEGVLDYRHTVPVTGLDTDAAVQFTLERFDARADLAAEIARLGPRIQRLLSEYQKELERSFSGLKQAA